MRKTISLNVLDTIEIATPCTASWEEMSGNDQTRYCSQCSLNVYNLSAMTREEATGIITGAEGRVCVRLYRRTDGTVLTQDCPTGLRAARERVRRSIRNIAATVATLAAGMLGLSAREASAQGGATSGYVMGDTTVIDHSLMEIKGQMTIRPAEITSVPMKLALVVAEHVATAPIAIEPVALEPIVIEPIVPAPLKTEPGFFVTGEMVVIDRPTQESKNQEPEHVAPVEGKPADEPECDPEAPEIR